MAHMNQEKKAKIAAQLKKVVPSTWKYSLSVHNHSSIAMLIKSAPINLIDIYTVKRCSEGVRSSALSNGYLDMNPYSYKDHFAGELLATMDGIFKALNLDNYDKSDHQSDYFDVGHYVGLSAGRWDKPFVVSS